jgi:hypothetical protein
MKQAALWLGGLLENPKIRDQTERQIYFISI